MGSKETNVGEVALGERGDSGGYADTERSRYTFGWAAAEEMV